MEAIGYKSANSHLHRMEALTELYDTTHDRDVKKLLAEALNINAACLYPDNPAKYAFHQHLDWMPAMAPSRAGLSYGHNVDLPG